MSYCLYYQAKVDRAKSWFFVAALRSFEHVAFDRTLDVDESIFEFFVPSDTQRYFLELMTYMEQEHIISDLVQLPNRLA